MKKILLFNLIIAAFTLNAQIGVGITNPNSESILELNSTNKGLLLSNVELQSIQSFVPLSAHSAAMLVYNTATNGVSPNNVSPGLYYNDGAAWQRLEGFGPVIGDIKNSVETADHNGWYLLNGRLISTLPAVAISNVASLGLGANLPNASNRIMKGRSGAETFAQAGGSTSFTILQTNLPAITYTGNTSSAGDHSHGYTDRGATIYHGSSGSAATGLNGVNNLTRNTGSAGDHTHSVTLSSGGSNTPVNLVPNHLVIQTFIYLGK